MIGNPADPNTNNPNPNWEVFDHQLEATAQACRRLVAEGGVDYDGRDVNPATFRRVLLGITLPDGKGGLW